MNAVNAYRAIRIEQASKYSNRVTVLYIRLHSLWKLANEAFISTVAVSRLKNLMLCHPGFDLDIDNITLVDAVKVPG